MRKTRYSNSGFNSLAKLDFSHSGGIAEGRRMLVESAWTYRHPPRIGAKKLYRLEAAPPRVREIAWKAQSRLTARYRALSGRGKKTTVVCTVIGCSRPPYAACHAV